jgi:hypothetical protein
VGTWLCASPLSRVDAESSPLRGSCQRPGEDQGCPRRSLIPHGRRRAGRDAVGQRLGGVEIANGDREPARATALRALADAGHVTRIGGSHHRERRCRVYPTASGESGSPRNDGFWPGVHSSRRAERASSRRLSDDRAATGPERVGPDIFQSSPIMRCDARHRYVPSDTDIGGMFAGFSGKSTSVRSRNRRIDSTLAGESLRHKGADYATRRLELPTFVWSVVPPGLDSPPPRIKPPKRSVAPPARQAAGPPEARPPRRCLQAIAQAEGVRGKRRGWVGVPMLCLCKTLGQNPGGAAAPRPQRASGAGARRCSLARAKGKRFRWCAVHCRSA